MLLTYVITIIRNQGDDFLKKNATRITTIVAVLLSLLWIFGLAWSIQDFYYGKADETEEKEPSEKVTENKQDSCKYRIDSSCTWGLPYKRNRG